MLSVLLMSLSVIYFKHAPEFIFVIFALSAIKFLLVAFQFMDMKNAHPFWKTILTLFIILVLSVIAIIIW
jgi:hypothetical protein